MRRELQSERLTAEMMLERVKTDMEEIVRRARNDPEPAVKQCLAEHWRCIQRLAEQLRTVQYGWCETPSVEKSPMKPKPNTDSPQHPTRQMCSYSEAESYNRPASEFEVGRHDKLLKEMHERLSRLRAGDPLVWGNSTFCAPMMSSASVATERTQNILPTPLGMDRVLY